MESKETLFHIEWGDGDHSFIIAPDGATAVERMTDGKDTVRSVTNLAELHKMIFKAGEMEMFKKLRQALRGEPTVFDYALDGVEVLWLYENSKPSQLEEHNIGDFERLALDRDVKEIVFQEALRKVSKSIYVWSTQQGGYIPVKNGQKV